MQPKTLLPVIIGTFGARRVFAQFGIQQTSSVYVSDQILYFGICICGVAIIVVGAIIYYAYGPKRRKETEQTNQDSILTQTPPQQATQLPKQSVSSTDMMFCCQCGFRISRKSKVCKECGAKQE